MKEKKLRREKRKLHIETHVWLKCDYSGYADTINVESEQQMINNIKNCRVLAVRPLAALFRFGDPTPVVGRSQSKANKFSYVWDLHLWAKS